MTDEAKDPQEITAATLQKVQELMPVWHKAYQAYLVMDRVDDIETDADDPLLELIVRGPQGQPERMVLDMANMSDPADRAELANLLQRHFYVEWRNATKGLALAFSRLEKSLQKQEAAE